MGVSTERIALVVGVDSYPRQPLRVCVHDASEVDAALSMPEYGFAVQRLLDKDVTRKALRRRLESFFRTQAKTYLFYFSGHGWSTDLGVFLATVDADTEEGEGGIDLELLKRLVTNVAVEESVAILILDCCHAGAGSIRHLATGSIEIRSVDLAQAIPALPEGRVLLAACRGDQSAYEDHSIGHGIFTFHLLQALLGEAADSQGTITVTGLYDYVSRALGKGGFQTPVFRGDLAGQVILGTGFMPRQRSVLDGERALGIEREAQGHLREYQSRVASQVADLENWRAEGYKTACLTLEPILRWFERQLQDYPELSGRSAFTEQREAALNRMATLCSLETGMTTPQGVISKRLGGGTFGTVWKVQPPRGTDWLAFKAYHAQDLGIEEKTHRFRRGYSAMKQLDHPYIVKVHSFTECPLGFNMDFIDGPNLRDFVGTVDEPREIIVILLTIAQTLRHAHSRGVLHRDVKPENIIMNWDDQKAKWRPFLTDFDLAWFTTATQFTKEALGVVYYASPEQQATPMSASAHAPTTDIYSFGQLCNFATTGSNPVPLGVADNLSALKKRLGTGWTAQAAEAFAQLYGDCTHRKPDERPSGFEEVCDTLFRIMQALSEVSTTKAIPPERFVREVVFSTVGLSSDVQAAEGSFLTLSGKTRVTVQVSPGRAGAAELTYDVEAQEAPVVDGVHKFDQLRKTLLARLDSTLKGFNARKRYLATPFQILVQHFDVPLTLQGVAQSRALISRIIDVLEGK